MIQRNMLRTADLEYDLPDRLIATKPAQPRDSARLLVVSRSDPRRLEHRTIRNLPELLAPGDAMVFNTTSVVPARLAGRRRDTGGSVSGLFIEEQAGRWSVLLKSNGRLRPGVTIDLVDAAGGDCGVSLELVERRGEGWLAAPAGAESAEEGLARVGATPLPPYILRARRAGDEAIDDSLDRAWYQTVFASGRFSGSVAAPTAGLHFTPELLARLAERGVRRFDVALQVGQGTFKPVEAEHVEEHDIHSERFFVPRETMRMIEARRDGAGRVLAVGTTSARTLESAAATARAGGDSELEGETRLLVTPGYEWRVVDGLVTNFHLPRSTLLAMVAALLPEGAGRLLEIYREAVRLEYRFYSYGDAMLVLP